MEVSWGLRIENWRILVFSDYQAELPRIFVFAQGSPAPWGAPPEFSNSQIIRRDLPGYFPWLPGSLGRTAGILKFSNSQPEVPRIFPRVLSHHPPDSQILKFSTRSPQDIFEIALPRPSSPPLPGPPPGPPRASSRGLPGPATVKLVPKPPVLIPRGRTRTATAPPTHQKGLA